MQGFSFKIRLDRNPCNLFLLCLILLTVPITWLFAWTISAAVHELGHLLMAWLLSVRVYGISLSTGGASIETESMEPLQELLCAAAGPAAGCLLLLLGRWFPMLAFSAFCHTAWNLLPFWQRDGSRIVRSLWLMARKIPCKRCQERVQ